MIAGGSTVTDWANHGRTVVVRPDPAEGPDVTLSWTAGDEATARLTHARFAYVWDEGGGAWAVRRSATFLRVLPSGELGKAPVSPTRLGEDARALLDALADQYRPRYRPCLEHALLIPVADDPSTPLPDVASSA